MVPAPGVAVEEPWQHPLVIINYFGQVFSPWILVAVFKPSA